MAINAIPGSNGGHLGFQDGCQRYEFNISSIDFVDLTNVYLDTKIVILAHTEAKIRSNTYFMTLHILGYRNGGYPPYMSCTNTKLLYPDVHHAFSST